ncbi:MAG: MarR family winged helix-turn-helix transcriptional regulator [Candidatus Gracilibacteria bacterium]|nr:MarR family winged helix-turn-helix transcriptional regulator [Candidatus Gracilibacteria bacterium]MDD2908350.1 MarR family winged helix-turn-helix transcriptional regulator [Candidatus Gracilibacteria bacterium]
MQNISKSLGFFINLSKTQTILSRKLDSSLGGISFMEFIILLNLSLSQDNKLRRIDLAGKIGLTASGVTRILLPMEKIGLVSREINENDARVSYVILAAGGKMKLEEAMERAELLVGDIIPNEDITKMGEFSDLLVKIGKTIIWN